MKHVIFTLMIVFCYDLSFSQDTLSSKNKNVSDNKKWQSSWRYFKLKRKITGVILEHQPTTVLCGKVTTASNSMIVTTRNDTIRVLEMCNTDKTFSRSDKVEITPDQMPVFVVDIVPPTAFDSRVKRTCYGSVKKIE